MKEARQLFLPVTVLMCFGLVVALAGVVDAAPRADREHREHQGPVLGLVLGTTGTVTPGPTASAVRDVPPLPWTPLYRGDAFFMTPGSSLSILCSTGSCRQIGDSFVLGEQTCSSTMTGPCAATVLPSSTVRSRDGTTTEDILLGEWLVAEHEWRLHGQARGPEERWGHDPVLVSPRCPASGPPRGCETWLDDPHELLFLAVEAADRYRFSLTGPGRFEPLTLEAGDLFCSPARPEFDGARICRHPWPETWPLPESGLPVRLGFQVELDGQKRIAEHRQRLQRVLPADRDPAFDALPGIAGDLLRALVHENADADLFASLVGRDLPPTLELKLAQLYLERDFPRPADRIFRHLIHDGAALPAPLQAEAEFGRAQTLFLLDEPDEARRQLLRAERAFEQLESEARQEEIQKLRHRILSALHQD